MVQILKPQLPVAIFTNNCQLWSQRPQAQTDLTRGSTACFWLLLTSYKDLFTHFFQALVYKVFLSLIPTPFILFYQFYLSHFPSFNLPFLQEQINFLLVLVSFFRNTILYLFLYPSVAESLVIIIVAANKPEF